jgi:hypothetical protein
MVVLFFFLQDREKSWKTRWTDGENGKELRTYQIVELLERKREKEQKNTSLFLVLSQNGGY